VWAAVAGRTGCHGGWLTSGHRRAESGDRRVTERGERPKES
jgi:hypothetical protein